MRRTSKGLVSGFLERISSQVFDDFHDEITEIIGKRHGVYALYKRKRLYYVGLATNLRNRVSHHLKDRHKKKWDRFSLYLIEDVSHLKELESLIVHVAEPKGNIQLGRFKTSENLRPLLKDLVTEKSRRNIEDLFGKTEKVKHKKKKSAHLGIGKRKPVLQGMFPAGTKLIARYKKVDYSCEVDAEGRLRLDGLVFNSPSMAGIHIRKKSTDGWYFWKFQNKNGEWVKIDELRKK